jgi:hippurate hydrolase
MTTAALMDALKAYEPELVDIHQYPETGFEEFRTASLLAERLRAWGLAVTERVGKTGVVATLKGKLPEEKAIGLRADMDALNIHEVPGLNYRSTVPGKW